MNKAKLRVLPGDKIWDDRIPQLFYSISLRMHCVGKTHDHQVDNEKSLFVFEDK